MEHEKQMTESESLELIASMINRAKNRFNENGFQYLLWGWAVLICCIVQFVFVKFFNQEKGYMVWLALWLVALFQVYYMIKTKKKKSVRTYTDGLVGFIWISFFVAVMLAIFICIRSHEPQMIYRILLSIYGIPVFLMGGLVKFRPLVVGGISCWILAAISPFVHPDLSVLLIAVAIIVAWIVPGYMMGRRYKKGVI